MAAKTKKQTRKILILGGGFGGVKAALDLAESPGFQVSLMSDHDDFRYYPSLYKTATGGAISASSIPLAEIFKDTSVKVVKAEATKIDRANKRVEASSNRHYPYDDLIIALGVVTNFFGIKGLDKYAYGIKNLDEAKRLRDHLHKQLVEEHRPDLNYVVIGGGPTGVELAGALPGYIKHVMKKHGIGRQKLHVDLVEAEKRILPRMSRSYSDAVARRLRRLGVKIYTSQRVEAETADTLMVNGRPLSSHSVVWTAGVTNHPFLKANKINLNQRGKAVVDPYLRTEPNIYVIGDNADTLYSGMAQTALYDGRFVAESLKKEAISEIAKPYLPKRPVYITPVGPGWAAVIWNKMHFYGRLGWALREAADLAGYHDLEPWWPASRHFMGQDDEASECLVCSPK